MTIKDIARLAGVTHSTVSRSLNDSPLVSPDTKQRILRIAADHGYSPNTFARRLVTRRSRTFGVFFLSRDEVQFMENFGTQFLEGIAARSHEKGYDLLFFTLTRDWSRQTSYLRLCRERRVEGAIFIGLTSDDPHWDEIAGSDLPVCVIDSPVEGPQVGFVTSDNETGVRAALDHLASLGHRDIAFLGGPEVSPVARLREAVYRRWMDDRGLAPLAKVVRGNFTKASGITAGGQLLDDRLRPTAVLAANDFMALGLLRACRDRGVRVPAQLSIVGYDNALAGDFSDPGLTTVAQNSVVMGAAAVDTLLGLIEGGPRPAAVRIEPQLVIRESTGVHRG